MHSVSSHVRVLLVAFAFVSASLVTTAAQQPPETPEGPADNGRTAIASVRITYDATAIQINNQTLESILAGAKVLGRAAKEVLGVDFGSGGARIRSSSGSRTIETRVTARLEPVAGDSFRPGDMLETLIVRIEDPKLKPAAEDLLKPVCDYLQQELRLLHDRRLEFLRADMKRAEEYVSVAEARLNKLLTLQRELLTESGLVEMTREAALRILHELEGSQQELQIQGVSQQARERAITTQIANIAKSSAESAANDPVATELQKVVMIRERELSRISKLVDAGQAASSDADHAIETLALSRAELAKARTAASRSAGGDLLGKLNSELVQITIDSAETQAKLEVTRARLEQLRQRRLLDLVERYEREVDRQLPQARNDLSNAINEHSKLRTQLESARPPEVTIVDRQP